MVWKIEYSDTAVKQLKKLDKQTARNIIDYLENTIAPLDDARTSGKALSGDLALFWRYRIGDFRTICHLDNGTITVLVLRVSHRGQAYEEPKKISKKAKTEIGKFRKASEEKT